MKDLPGKFITFEGSEGGGKTTQVKRLAEKVIQMGKEVVLTREPGGTSVGEMIRNILKSPGLVMLPKVELMLFEAARNQLVNDVIKPALKEGKIVISDRFSDSTVAYQHYARGIPRDYVGLLNELGEDGILPDVTILLDIPVEIGLYRAATRNNVGCEVVRDRFEDEKVEFHSRVRAGYAQIAKDSPNRVFVVDAVRSVDEVWCDVWKHLSGFFR